MPIVVEANNCVQAWAKGVLALRDNHAPISPLITEIQNPAFFDTQWWTAFCPRRIQRQLNSLHGVVEMVGPDEITNLGLTRPEIYTKAWRKYDRCRARGIHLSNWRETYFERLTRCAPGVNRLETIISKMNSWNGRRVASFFAHTTSNVLDSIVPIGNPCLQYVQFLQREGNRIDLMVAYRNHDFLRKALGNYVGLGRLLSFVARETNQSPGSLVCFSANAYLEQAGKTTALAQTALP